MFKCAHLPCIRLGDILNTETESVLLIQAAQAIGSIAHGMLLLLLTTSADDVHVPAIVQTGLVPLLIAKIFDPNTKVVEAMLRTLRIIYTCPQAPISLLFEQVKYITYFYITSRCC